MTDDDQVDIQAPNNNSRCLTVEGCAMVRELQRLLWCWMSESDWGGIGGGGETPFPDSLFRFLMTAVSSPNAKTPQHLLEEPAAPRHFSGKLLAPSSSVKTYGKATILCFQL